VSYMLDTLIERGYNVITGGECMGHPRVNWYRDAGGIPLSSSPPTPTTSTSISDAVQTARAISPSTTQEQI